MCILQEDGLHYRWFELVFRPLQRHAHKSDLWLFHFAA